MAPNGVRSGSETAALVGYGRPHRWVAFLYVSAWGPMALAWRRGWTDRLRMAAATMATSMLDSDGTMGSAVLDLLFAG